MGNNSTKVQPTRYPLSENSASKNAKEVENPLRIKTLNDLTSKLISYSKDIGASLDKKYERKLVGKDILTPLTEIRNLYYSAFKSIYIILGFNRYIDQIEMFKKLYDTELEEDIKKQKLSKKLSLELENCMNFFDDRFRTADKILGENISGDKKFMKIMLDMLRNFNKLHEYYVEAFAANNQPSRYPFLYNSHLMVLSQQFLRFPMTLSEAYKRLEQTNIEIFREIYEKLNNLFKIGGNCYASPASESSEDDCNEFSKLQSNINEIYEKYRKMNNFGKTPKSRKTKTSRKTPKSRKSKKTSRKTPKSRKSKKTSRKTKTSRKSKVF